MGELKTASMSMFVNECLMLTVERSSTARHHTGAMLHHLVRNHHISMSNYVQGLHEFLSLADDMVIDVPRIWQYIAELISPMLLDEKSEVPMDFLRSACSPLLSCEGGDKAALVISMVLLDAVHSLVNSSLSLSLSLCLSLCQAVSVCVSVCLSVCLCQAVSVCL